MKWPVIMPLWAETKFRLVLGEYRHSSELVIDPVIGYSTFLGGSKSDLANAIAVDSRGDAYITGWTQSSDFPVTSGKYHGSLDAFVSELNPDGTALDLFHLYWGQC